MHMHTHRSSTHLYIDAHLFLSTLPLNYYDGLNTSMFPKCKNNASYLEKQAPAGNKYMQFVEKPFLKPLVTELFLHTRNLMYIYPVTPHSQAMP